MYVSYRVREEVVSACFFDKHCQSFFNLREDLKIRCHAGIHSALWRRRECSVDWSQKSEIYLTLGCFQTSSSRRLLGLQLGVAGTEFKPQCGWKRRGRCLRRMIKTNDSASTQVKDAENRGVSEILLLSRLKASVLAVQRPPFLALTVHFVS